MIRIAILEDRRLFANDLKMMIELSIENSTVECFYNVDSAVESILEKQEQWDVWIVDLMMEPGNFLEDEKNSDGLITGEIFIRDILGKYSEGLKCAYVYSARSGHFIESILKFEIKYVEKSATTQVELAKLIKSDMEKQS